MSEDFRKESQIREIINYSLSLVNFDIPSSSVDGPKLLFPIVRKIKFVNFATSGERVPVSKLLSRSNSCSEVRSKSDEGISPEI